MTMGHANLGDFHGLNFSGVPDVRPATEIDQRTTAVNRGCRRLHTLPKQPLLELVAKLITKLT